MNALWRAVDVRLTTDMLGHLQAGETVGIGEINVRDSGVVLKRQRLLRFWEPVILDWAEINALIRFIDAAKKSRAEMLSALL